MGAKVFISCGQREPIEKEVVEKIKKFLKDEGFEPYVAIQVQSLEGLRENIFTELKTSDYFLFIDFKRERVVPDSTKYGEFNRGSLFTHQELALASYLKLPTLAFFQTGTKREGMMDIMQLNAQEFTEYYEVLEKIREVILRGEWNTRHKNTLMLGKPIKVVINDQKRPRTYKCNQDKAIRAIRWEIPVTNKSYLRDATGCSVGVYLTNGESLENLECHLKGIMYPNIRGLKWVGSADKAENFPRVIKIGDHPPIESEAFVIGAMVIEDEPIKGYLATVGDDGEYDTPFFQVPECKHRATFDLTYFVTSSNFELVSANYRLTLDQTIGNFKLEKLSEGKSDNPEFV